MHSEQKKNLNFFFLVSVDAMIIHSKVTEKNLPYYTFNLKVSQKRKELYALSPDPWEFRCASDCESFLAPYSFGSSQR